MSARIKGVAFRTFLAVFEAKFGRETTSALIDAVRDDELRDALRYGKIVAGGWYPIRWYGALHEAAQSLTRVGPALAREIGRLTVQRDLGSVYRVFVAMLSPEWILSKGPRFYAQYYDTGQMEVTRLERGSGAARFTGCVGFDRNVWQDMLGGIEAVLTACGARAVRIEVKRGGGDGDTSCEISATWQ